MDGELAFKHLTIIGLGLIGGSLAMAARERFPDWHIQGVDPNSNALQFALKHQIIDQASLTLPMRFETPHLIVLACHLTPAIETLRQLAPLVKGQPILVTDIGSCKQAIGEVGRELLPREFIGGHPMAGKEFSGIEHATSLLFSGKSYLLCPHEQSDSHRVESLKGFVRHIGGIPRFIEAERHDRYMAYVSHLPQLYSVMLTQLLYRNEPGHLMAYHGAGLDDQLRLAASPYSMWGDIFGHNAAAMKEALTELRGILDEAMAILEQAPGTEGALEAWFTRANEIHRQFQSVRTHRTES